VSTQQNSIAYSNNNGIITWTHSNFLDDLSINGDLTFPGSIKIGDSFAYVNPAGISGNINSPANVTLKGNPGAGISDPVIIKDGAHCPDCHNFTLLDAETVKFNVSGFSNYSIGESLDNPPVSLCPDSMSGFGNSSHPCLIKNCSDLNATRQRRGLRYKLNNDIDCNVVPFKSGIKFEPIGNSTHPFNGILNGNEKTISGLFINRSSDNHTGLFGYISENAILRNLELTNADVIGWVHAGVLAGQNLGTIDQCNVKGTVTLPGDTYQHTYYGGGLVGYNNGTILDSSFNGTVTGQQYRSEGGSTGGIAAFNAKTGTINNSYTYGDMDSKRDAVGGLVGKNYGNISNCSSYMEVSNSGSGYRTGGFIGYNGVDAIVVNSHAFGDVNGQSWSGGFIGSNYGDIENCSASGDVTTTTNDNWVGGFIGQNYGGTITKSFASGDVYCPGSYSGGWGYSVGGFIGKNSGSISDCYATGDVRARSDAGGFIGHSDTYGTITRCYATGNVNATHFEVGGFIGDNEQGTISHSFATGNVSGGSTVGGFTGDNNFANFNNIYWNNKSGNPSICMGDNYNPGACTVIQDNESYFKGNVYPSNAPMSSWDFSAVWQERTADYPSLAWQNLGISIKTINESGTINGSVIPGDNLTINASTTKDVDSVWVVIWDGVVDTSVKIYEGIMNFIGDAWNVVIGTNESFQEGETNYTVYANDTGGYTEGITGKFNVTCPVMPGLGTVGVPYSISYCCQLQHMQDNLTAYYQLINNIDCAGTELWNEGAGFAPIGSFSGTLDGKNKTVTGLYINRGGVTGLIYYNSGSVKNIGLINVNVTGGQITGSLVGNNYGSVDQCYVNGGAVVGSQTVGGLVGYTYQGDTVTNSYAVLSRVGGGLQVGGLVGYNYGTILDSYANANNTGGMISGGLVGQNYGIINNSFSTGDVVSGWHNGGLIGEHSTAFGGSISNLYWNNHAGNPSSCIGDGSGDCTSITDNESYFQNDVYPLNAPMNSRDFFDTWEEANNSYPVLTWQGIGGDICESLAGSGTALDPYKISKCCQLELIEDDLSADYILTANVDCSDSINWDSGQGYMPVGRSSPYFTGTFDGKNYTISNLYINRSTEDRVGLFGRADIGSEIRNVGLIDVNITGKSYTGGLIGYFYKGGIVDRTFTTGSITGSSSYIAGLIGYAYANKYATHAIINNSYSTATVRAYNLAGGFMGRCGNGVDIYNSYSTGNVTATGQYAGAFIGMFFDGIIQNSFSTGTSFASIYPSGFTGFASSGDPNELINVYWYDQPSDEAYYCYTSFDNAPGDINCVKINDANGGLNYFKGDVYPNLDPMYYWDFTNVWEERANDYPSLKGFGLGGTVDDDPDLITDAVVYNKYDYQDEFNEIGTNVSFNVTTIIDTDNVWMTIWNTTVGGNIIWQGSLTNSTHRDWSVAIETNNTFPSANVNYTIYANNTLKENNRTELYFACPTIAGAGNSSDPYQITSCCQLHSLDYNRAAYYILANDIDCTMTNPSDSDWTSDGFWGHGRGFDPIAKGSSFSGQLDGNGSSINGVYINTSEPASSMGLFATLASSGLITNLYMTNINITFSNGIRNNYMGGLVGYNSGDITSTSITGYINVPSGYRVGCLVGLNGENSLIDKAHTKCRVDSYDDVGGIVGSNFNNGIIRNSYSESNVTGDTQVGGIAGYNYNAWVGKISRIENCYAIGNITGRSDVGGLVGWNKNIINNSFAAANVTITASYYKGGLVGDQDGTIENCHWYDDPNDDATSCFGSGSGDCTEHVLSYFQGDVYPSNEPMASWNFLTTWQEMGYDFPIVSWISGEGTNLTTVSSCSGYVGQAVILNSDVVFCGENGRIWPIMLDHEVTPGKEAARTECKSFTHAGFSDWFLPFADTMHAFGEDVCGWDPACDGDCPECAPADWDPNVAADPGVQWYWVNNTYPGQPTWDLVMFQNGDFMWVGSGTVNVRCVRQICPGNMTGKNTSASPCMIKNCKQLQKVDQGLDGYYALKNNINCSDTLTWNSGAGFDPVGQASPYFTGSFDGKNYTISDLYINRSTEDNVGLFGRTTSASNIFNVGMIDVNISGQDYVGGIVGLNYGTLNQTHSSGYLHSVFEAPFDGSWAGGIIGKNYGTIVNSYSSASVNSDWKYAGGLVGDNYGTIEDCYATGTVYGATQDIGGLAGQNYNAVIRDSFATGDVSGGNNKGGLVGWNNFQGKIYTSYYNNHAGNPSSCIAMPAGDVNDCTTITDNESYFQGNVYPNNEPMTSWTFYTIWEEKESDYPILSWQNNIPSVSSVTLNATSSNNLSADNLTGYVTASDVDGDSITYAYNWYKDGTLNATTLITNGLVAYYPLNNNTFDYWGSYDGTNNGSVRNATDYKVGAAYDFDGVDDYISVDGLAGNYIYGFDYTYVAWVKPTNFNNQGDIFLDGALNIDGFEIYVDTDGTIGVYDPYNNCIINSNTAITANAWSFIVITVDLNGGLEFYINGALDKDGVSCSFVDSTGSFSISSFDIPFLGSIDEPMIYSTILTPSEIKQLYWAGVAGGHTMNSSQTTVGDSWKLGVKAADLTGWGNERNSTALTILSS